MRKHLVQNAAYEVATQVRAVEDSIDAALAEIAELQARVMRANSVARTSTRLIMRKTPSPSESSSRTVRLLGRYKFATPCRIT